QIERDFRPEWKLSARLHFEASDSTRPRTEHPPAGRRDALLYLVSGTHGDIAGYHEQNHHGLPYGMVYVGDEDGDPWSATLSHETLELLADPHVNLLVQGPHPTRRGHQVFFWYETADAVEDETYTIEDVVVSNFLLP